MNKKKTGPKTKLFSFHIDIGALEKAQTLARIEHRSIASVINQALSEFFKEEFYAKKIK